MAVKPGIGIGDQDGCQARGCFLQLRRGLHSSHKQYSQEKYRQSVGGLSVLPGAEVVTYLLGLLHISDKYG